MTPWERARLAVDLAAVDPTGLGGLWVRARCGPARDAFVDLLDALPRPKRKLHAAISDEQLFGGVDLAATLASGHIVWSRGLLAEPASLILPMAERAGSGLAARLARALDQGDGHCLVAMDEGAEKDESLPSALVDRLAFHLDLDGLGLGDLTRAAGDPVTWRDPRRVATPVGAISDLTLVAVRLGIASLRAPLLALRAARAHAALRGASIIETEDLSIAVALVLAPRATQMPDMEPDPEEAPPEQDPQDRPPDPIDGADAEPSDSTLPPAEMLLAAVAAILPPDLLARVAAGRTVKGASQSSGSGAGKTGNRRGRPLPSRPGRLDGSARIDLVATLRAAAPWQKVRAALRPTAPNHLLIQPSDIRTKRYKETSDRVLIFVVDASGSAAMTRLAEAKGAVELLLAEAYARRDHVALVAFRGTGADLLLPPTRSLVQTKRRLAALPGGGGTPLAAGLKTGMEIAHQSRSRGMTPTLALLTDGRANIALDGVANRAQASQDATGLARLVRASSTPALVIDMGPRPQPPLRALADTMAAPYVPLPRADAGRLSSAVSAALET